jgi:hypothetical protein
MVYFIFLEGLKNLNAVAAICQKKMLIYTLINPLAEMIFIDA